MRAAACSLFVAVVLVACGGPGDAHVFTAGDITVTDESGLVTDAVVTEPPPLQQLGEPSVTSGDSLTQVIVAWSGPSCVQGWGVRMAGNALTIQIEPRSETSGCEGVPAAYAVLLDLNVVVQADGIDVSLTGS